MHTDDEILDAILRREGGYVNHPADRGGPTNFGITLKTLAAWRMRPATPANAVIVAELTADDVKALTEAEAREIYRANYLAPFADTDPEIRPQLVDIAVNSGVSRATQLLHRALDNHRSRPLNTQLAIERLKFYARIVKANPKQSVFIEGWVNRAVEFLR